jgi:hypothetical protein
MLRSWPHRRAVRSEIAASREISGQGESVLQDAENSSSIRCLAFGMTSDARKACAWTCSWFDLD